MIRPTTFLAASLTVLAGATASAQVSTAGSPLAIRTTDPGLARQFLRTFDSSESAPELEDGAIAVLALDDGGGVLIAQAPGEDWLQIEARPSLLVDLYAAQMSQALSLIRGGVGLGATQAGMDPREARQAAEALLAFPEQIALLVVTLPTRPESPDDVDVTIRMEPEPGTWFAGLCSSLRPSASGMRGLDDAGAMLRLDIDVDLPAALPSLLPVVMPLSTLTLRKAEDRDSARALTRTLYEAMSGGFSVTVSSGMRVGMLTGLRDAEATRELVHSTAWGEMNVRSVEAGRRMTAEFETEAFRHQDLPVASQTVEFDDPDLLPFVRDGILESFTAVAGDCLVSALLDGAAAHVRALVDDALAGRPERAPLGQGVVMRAEIRLVQLAQVALSMMPGLDARASEALDRLPEHVRMELATTDNGLRMRLRTR